MPHYAIISITSFPKKIIEGMRRICLKDTMILVKMLKINLRSFSLRVINNLQRARAKFSSEWTLTCRVVILIGDIMLCAALKKLFTAKKDKLINSNVPITPFDNFRIKINYF